MSVYTALSMDGVKVLLNFSENALFRHRENGSLRGNVRGLKIVI